MATDVYKVVDSPPTMREYRDLCVAVGWEGVINFDAARTSLKNSLFCVVVVHRGNVVGMGRIIGDGAIFFYIQDVAVHPDHQRRGVGSSVVARLMEYLASHAPDKAFVGLFAAGGTEPFYRRFGFMQHPDLIGMFTVTPN